MACDSLYYFVFFVTFVDDCFFRMMSTWESKYADSYGKGGMPQDVADYFSVNAKSFPYTQPLRVKKGDVLRMRFYGAGDGTHMMHMLGHDMLITHKDGCPLANPYYVDTVPVGPGERYDVIVKMKNPGYFVMHDHADKHITNNGAVYDPQHLKNRLPPTPPEQYNYRSFISKQSRFERCSIVGENHHGFAVQ